MSLPSTSLLLTILVPPPSSYPFAYLYNSHLHNSTPPPLQFLPPFSPSPSPRYNLQTPLNASSRFKPPPPPPSLYQGAQRLRGASFLPSTILFHLPPKFWRPTTRNRLRNAPCTEDNRERGRNQANPTEIGTRVLEESSRFRGSFEASVAKLLNASRICARRFQTGGGGRVIVCR